MAWEAEPQVSHWRQRLEQARLEKSLVPDLQAPVLSHEIAMLF